MADSPNVPLLRLEDVDLFYGGLQALWSVSFQIQVGSVTSLLGANGSGKSTALAAISGVRRVAKGRVSLEGKDITSMSARNRVAEGIGHVLERQHVFPVMSVRDNLEIGGYTLSSWSQRHEAMEKVLDLFPRLKPVIGSHAGDLSGGEQAMLVIGRALMVEPRILLLDEPFIGVAPSVIKEIEALIKQLQARGITIVVVDQNVHRALGLSDTCVVLAGGRVVHHGPTDEPDLVDTITDMYLRSGAA